MTTVFVPADSASGGSGTVYYASNGAAALPAYAFTNDATTGMYYSAAALNFAVSGVKVVAFSATAATFSTAISGLAGTGAAPGVALGAVGDGLFRVSAGVMGLTGTGVEVARFSATLAQLPAASVLTFNGRSAIRSGADSYLTLTDNAGTAFTGLRFGGVTASYPMWKRSTTTLTARLADDSGDAGLLCGALTASGALAGSNFNVDGTWTAQKALVTAATPPPELMRDDFHFATNNFYYTGGTTGSVTTNNLGAAPAGSGNGTLQLSTTTGATNGAVVMHGYNSLLGRYASFRGRIGFWVPALSDGTDTYTIYAGSWSTAGLSPSRQCVYLKYTHGTNSGKFQVLTNNGATTFSTGVTVAANTFYVFDWVVTVSAPDTANNPVTWNIYSGAGVLAETGTGVVTAPTAVGAGTETAMLGAEIVKSLGTTARLLLLDYWEFIGLYV